MNPKKLLRFLVFLFFLILATCIPVPINFYKKDTLPVYKVEQLEKREEEDKEEDDTYQMLA